MPRDQFSKHSQLEGAEFRFINLEAEEKKIEPKGCKHLPQGRLSSLIRFSLRKILFNKDGNSISEKGLNYLSKNTWTSLREVYFSKGAIGDRGLNNWKMAPSKKILVLSLSIDSNNLDDAGFSENSIVHIMKLEKK